MNKICVLGSINMDLVVKVNDIPRVGETILSKSFEKIAGGKGANQAIAAKRCGAEVSMISKIGKDENGKILKSKLEEDKISTECIFEDEKEATGMAFIMVNESGNNSIIVVSGSNMAINEEEIEASIEKIKEADIVIAQFETPEEMTLKVFKKAKELGKSNNIKSGSSKENK